MAIYGDRVAIDGGEIVLSSAIDGGEGVLSSLIDGGELGSTTMLVPNLQNKTVTPSDDEQIITADLGYNGLHSVTVERIPSNYGHIAYNGSVLMVY